MQLAPIDASNNQMGLDINLQMSLPFNSSYSIYKAVGKKQ